MLNFLPGQPNDDIQTLSYKKWGDETILAYCSGNSVIIVSEAFKKLQTVYFEGDTIAVDINEGNGLIAVSVGSSVYLYRPDRGRQSSFEWVLCKRVYHDDSRVNCLRWGEARELVVASDYISLWDVKIEEEEEAAVVLLWTQRHPCPVYSCAVSEDSQFIATTGKYDKNVKVWRRMSSFGDQALFDLSLIPHSGFVTMIKWKRVSCKETQGCHILYTLCDDFKLRIWSNFEIDNRNTVQDWGTITLDVERGERFVVLIDSSALAELQTCSGASENVSLSRPELLGIMSTSGEMRVLALQNLSEHPPKLLNVVHLGRSTIPYYLLGTKPEFLYFSGGFVCSGSREHVSLAVHDLRGFILHLRLPIARLLDPASEPSAGTFEHVFTGHSKSIKKLIRSDSGNALLTISRFNENKIWMLESSQSGSILKFLKSLHTDAPIQTALLLDDGKLVVVLQESKLELWDCDGGSTKFGTKSFELSVPTGNGRPFSMVRSSKDKKKPKHYYIALIYENGVVEFFHLNYKTIQYVGTNRIMNDEKERIYIAAPIDPVNYTSAYGGNLISTISNNGTIKTYTNTSSSAEFDTRWKVTFEIKTNLVNCSLMATSSINKVCLVDAGKSAIQIWDLNKQLLEYTYEFENEILDIDWTSNYFGQSILSVGFSNHVILLTQIRYDYTNDSPGYLPIKKIDVSHFTTHNIGDSTWLKNGTFVIASGNQLFVEDKQLNMSDKFTSQSIGSRSIVSSDLFHLTSVLNGPLPVYHPQFLIQCIYFAKLELVREIAYELSLYVKELEFNSELKDVLPSNLGIHHGKFFCSQHKHYISERGHEMTSDANLTQLRTRLTKIALPYLTRHQQVTLITVLEAIELIDKYEQIVDLNGLRFLLGVKLYHPHKRTQSSLTMRDVSWALHSENKELLLSVIEPELNLWSHACEYKISYWLDNAELRRIFETIAKYEFTKDSKRNPNNCAVFYLALRKKNILVSLWRIATGHPEQAKMLNFLKNDFTQPRWRTAALKNAFVLLSKHRYLDSACFFLLADSLKDAVNVLVNKLDNLELALGISRIYEGDDGPTVNDLLKNIILTNAVRANDSWTASYVFWKLKNRSVAIKCLLCIPKDVLATYSKDARLPEHNSYLVIDPALLHLYADLRKAYMVYFRNSSDITDLLEYNAVTKVADIYSRMGCQYLSVCLVSTWKFISCRLPSAQLGDGSQANNNILTSSETTSPIFSGQEHLVDHSKSYPSILDDYQRSDLSSKSNTMFSGSQDPHKNQSPEGRYEQHQVELDKNYVSGTGPEEKVKNILDDYM